MMTITPNFNFDGKCGEAITLYQQAFGAKVDCLLHYRDADQSDFKRELSEEQKGYAIIPCDEFSCPTKFTNRDTINWTFRGKNRTIGLENKEAYYGRINVY